MITEEQKKINEEKAREILGKLHKDKDPAEDKLNSIEDYLKYIISEQKQIRKELDIIRSKL